MNCGMNSFLTRLCRVKKRKIDFNDISTSRGILCHEIKELSIVYVYIFWFRLVSLFDSISVFMGHLMPKPSL